MIEVFRTDVDDRDQADLLISQIHETLQYCRANFDLDDCDRILRVKGITGEGDVYRIISLMRHFGCQAEILPDDDQLFDSDQAAHKAEFVNR